MTKYLLAFYRGRKQENRKTTWLDRLICFLSKCEYSHVELIYEHFEDLGVGFTWSCSPRYGGIRPGIIRYKSPQWDVYEITVDRSKEEVEKWFEEYQHVEFDYFTVFGIYMNRPNKLNAAEVIVRALGLDKNIDSVAKLSTLLKPKD